MVYGQILKEVILQFLDFVLSKGTHMNYLEKKMVILLLRKLDFKINIHKLGSD